VTRSKTKKYDGERPIKADVPHLSHEIVLEGERERKKERDVLCMI
jgi:hypothetical protein